MTATTSPRPTACLALADGSLFYGMGFGATEQLTFGPAVVRMAGFARTHRDWWY